jgi:four helix bundle protein
MFQDLTVYKQSYSLAISVHSVSRKLPQYLQFDLADQMRRAARSIPSNIAEGCGRNQSLADTVRFIKLARGSNDEIIFQLSFCRDTQLLREDLCKPLIDQYIANGKQLTALIKYHQHLIIQQSRKPGS